ncbi:MAG TPA: CocE/NonD family hydrolase [Gemmatimonadales bacterium]|nr:CocE/NonD family hydrolase [Gemmatimonadales bacterium]
MTHTEQPLGPSVSRRDFTSAMLTTAGWLVLSRRFPGRADEGDVTLYSNVMVAMRDGVRLATDIYVPSGARRFPVILERTPYDKTAPSRSERTASNPTPMTRAELAGFFARHGYVVVYQDCRGRYQSEGVFVKYVSDAQDGYDTCAWILKQPWCDGRIGTMGLSYAAHTQAALGSAGAPGIAAMFLDSGGFSNAYQGGIRQGGAFELKQATWAYSQALESPEIQRDSARLVRLRSVDIKNWFRRMPWRRRHSPVSLAPEYEDYLFEQWEHGVFDDYWKRPGLWAEGFHDRFPDGAMVHMSSWYDAYARTATDNYIGLSRRKRRPVHLIMGPWTHGDRQLTYAGDVDFGPAATLDGNLAPDFPTFRLRWFDRWLKGIRNGVDAEPKVRLFVMGGGSGRKNQAGRLEHGGSWRAESDWPIPNTRWTPWYLHADGSLSRAKPSAKDAFREYEYDPRHPVPTIGGTVTSGQPVMVGGAFDQREGDRFFGSQRPYRALADRSDVLVFETAPLEEAVEVTGPVSVKLWISSSAVDTDFTAKLIDVYPPSPDYPGGFAMNLTDGILRVRYRDSWERPARMAPGTVYSIRIDAFPTSNRFARGHRIRIDISSSNFPHFDLNPNTGEPEGRATRFVVATNRVYLGRARPSHVVLPLIPPRGRSEKSNT